MTTESRLSYRIIFACLMVLAAGLPAGRAAAQEPSGLPAPQLMDLWPDGAPGRPTYDGEVPEEHRTDAGHVEFVSKPTLELYRPAEGKANGAAVVICPGGGYRILADGHEGVQVAEWLRSNGVTAIILRYRMFPYRYPVPLMDVQRAVRTVRANAEGWGIDPQRIGIIGFSAGGHLASTAVTHFVAGHDQAEDPVERFGSRPDFAILVYPVISMSADVTHGGSRNNLLGPDPDPALVDLMSSEKQVTKRTPPTLLVHSRDDGAVPIANSELFLAALKENDVPGELIEFETGGHGYGLGRGESAAWPDKAVAWLKSIGVME